MITISRSMLLAAAVSLTLLQPVSAQANDSLPDAFSHTIDHINDHGVSVVQSSDGGSLVVLETEFKTRNTAELRVLLGRNGVPAREADLGSLARVSGLQVFRAPPSVDVSTFSEVYIWNPQNNVVVGVAPLN